MTMINEYRERGQGGAKDTVFISASKPIAFLMGYREGSYSLERGKERERGKTCSK
jgi:hypothetical protein